MEIGENVSKIGKWDRELKINFQLNDQTLLVSHENRLTKNICVQLCCR